MLESTILPALDEEQPPIATAEQFDLFANVKPLIVPGADVFSKPMTALGVLYYQIRDRL